MNISIITVFPEIFEPFLRLSLIGRAVEKGIISFNILKFSDFCTPPERIDQPTAGPGAGMILKPSIVEKAINSCQKQWGKGLKIFFSPQGIPLSQPVLQHLVDTHFLQNKNQNTLNLKNDVSSQKKHLILICPRYEGMDARVEKTFADIIISIGDYVLMGGDLPAQIFLEGLLRLIPNIVGRIESVKEESFSGPFLDHPEYSLPNIWNNQEIPPIIQSGNHAAIKEWRHQAACKKTVLHRFDWFKSQKPKKTDCTLALSTIPSHYVVLMHTDVLLKDGSVGTTSITSIDLHDGARSCRMYGIKNYFMVTPLLDQQKIITTFLNFWHSESGKLYNQSRFQAVERVIPTLDLDTVIKKIISIEGKAPLIVATSAKTHEHQNVINFYNQGDVWKHQRPVLLLFGTGQGLSSELNAKCDFFLEPIVGMTDYNHLSVRSAIAVVLDRWLGLNPKI